jgi:CBS domain-containing protein
MKISDILRNKPAHSGADVVTIAPGGTIRELLALLAEHGIGALVVTDDGSDGGRVRGVVSERDVVRHLHRTGAGALGAALDVEVAQIMAPGVLSCRLRDDVDTIAATMTERRTRHLPVIEDGALVGLVSIGDVVSSRMRQLEQDRGQLEQYIAG